MHHRIVLAGGTGFLGTALSCHFRSLGWEVIVLTRHPRESSEGQRQVEWDGRTVGSWVNELGGAAALVNLAGRSVNCRYNPPNQRSILESRVDSTRVLGEAVAGRNTPPPIWLNLSTATIYRHTLGPAWDESGEIGSTPAAKDQFSVAVAEAWERAFAEAAVPGTRKVALRSAMVLGSGGNSVFPVLRRLVRTGLGGKMGGGNQWVSWIHEEDFCRALEWIIRHETLSGPINVAAPHPVTNREMMRVLREICGVPAGLPATFWMLEVGAWLLRTETELIIKSRRVIPARLLADGFPFRFPVIRDAFVHLSGK